MKSSLHSHRPTVTPKSTGRNAFSTCFAAVLLQCRALWEPVVVSALAPAMIAPKETPQPAAADTADCTQNSMSASWDVRGLFYQRIDVAGLACINPSGQCPQPYVPYYYGDIEFDLVNNATGDSRHCKVQAILLSDVVGSSVYSSTWLPCEAGLIFFLPEPSVNHLNTTYFRFDHSSNMLELNQTWYCDDLGAWDEDRFDAYGAVSPALDPSVNYVGNKELGAVRVDGISLLTVLATVNETRTMTTRKL